jgi:hypothetical protein
MAKALVSEVGRVSFELDRFELVGESWEVHGRWYGVRGRRFMRPALTLTLEGRPTRLLADLAHKPWPAEDGEPWQALFPGDAAAGELDEAELTVAPDVTVALPAPTGRRPSRRRRAATDHAGPARSRGEASRPSPDMARPRGETARAGSRRAGADPVADLTRELGKERAVRQRLERQLERAENELGQAVARADELTAELARLAGERDAARAAGDETEAAYEGLQRVRDQVAAELEGEGRERRRVEAELEGERRERRRVEAELEGERRERRRVEAERTAALQERDEAERGAEAAAAEREGALALRDHALAERDAAKASHDDAVAQRDALARTNERLQNELSDLLSARGAALVMRRAALDSPASRPFALLVPRVIAGAALLVIAVVVLLGLHVI